MASVKSPFDISGKIYDFVICKRNGKSYIRKSTSLEGDRWWRHRSLNRTRDKAIEFGGASQLSAEIRNQLPISIRKLFHPYAHNKLASAIRQSCADHRQENPGAYPGNRTPYLSAFSAKGIANAIPGLQLGNAHTSTAPTATLHAHSAEGLRISIQGLRNHALLTHAHTHSHTHAHSPTHAASQREFRIHIAFATTNTFLRNPHASRRQSDYTYPGNQIGLAQTPLLSSEWASTAAIDPSFDILDLPRIPLPEIANPQPGQQLLIFVAIEWRQRTGKRSKALPELSTVQGLIAIPCTPGQETPTYNRATRRRPNRRTNPRPMTRHRSPNPPLIRPHERLAAALKALAPPE